MLFITRTRDRRYRIGIDTTVPGQRANVFLQAAAAEAPIVIATYDNPDDAEMCAVFFTDCYNEATAQGFQLACDSGTWYFRNLAGLQVPITEALNDRTPEEFAELLQMVITTRGKPLM